MWVVAGAGSNQRRIVKEREVIAAARQVVLAERPGWRFETLDTRRMSYVEELRVFAQADALVSLFGSAMHNCRFMANGSLLVEIHGALRNDFAGDYYYQRICEGPLGIRWLGYAPVGFRPPPKTSNVTTNYSAGGDQEVYTSNYSFSKAAINIGDFRTFLSQALRGGHDEAWRTKYSHVTRAARGTGRLAENARYLQPVGKSNVGRLRM